ncbi:hypothetical protein BDV25DRAFT_155680 [Aspergillus avenaceus]|uniref:Uncharacterized protein n=1 Tax=Aspergillus avenaceus TaxID=36643 RepID=A0A5N6TTX0_ASPAV|nr:hypothetical protein BDV25DRAFT_155680 [Aspergillus avenaceus]
MPVRSSLDGFTELEARVHPINAINESDFPDLPDPPQVEGVSHWNPKQKKKSIGRRPEGANIQSDEVSDDGHRQESWN